VVVETVSVRKEIQILVVVKRWVLKGGLSSNGNFFWFPRQRVGTRKTLTTGISY
jgi:hypothetical protein